MTGTKLGGRKLADTDKTIYGFASPVSFIDRWFWWYHVLSPLWWWRQLFGRTRGI